jgi:hypothetical protein
VTTVRRVVRFWWKQTLGLTTAFPAPFTEYRKVTQAYPSDLWTEQASVLELH